MDKRKERLYKVKRTLVETPKGIRAYYFRNGKRISDDKGRRAWLKQNFKDINKPYAKVQPVLTEKEQKSFKNSKAQRNLFTYNGKKVKKFITEILKLYGDLSDKDPREITKILNPDGTRRFKNYGQFEQLFNRKVEKLKNDGFLRAETQRGAVGHRGRTTESSIFSMMENLEILGVDNWKLLVIDRNGNSIFKKEEGIKAIQDWEISELEAMQDDKKVAAMQFFYDIQYDFTNKTIIIDLRIAKGEPMRSL
jgi:hypothetical protein